MTNRAGMASGSPEVTLRCGCITQMRYGNARVSYLVTGYGEFVCPHAHVVGDVIDGAGRVLVERRAL